VIHGIQLLSRDTPTWHASFFQEKLNSSNHVIMRVGALGVFSGGAGCGKKTLTASAKFLRSGQIRDRFSER
jgi:hypothetical protein